MMEMAQGTGQGQDTHVPSPAVTAPVQQEHSAPERPADERVFTQSDVDRIVGKVKREAAERRSQSEQPHQAQQQYGDVAQQQRPQQPSNPATAAPDENTYRKIAAEEAQRLRDQWVQDSRTRSEQEYAQRIVQNFTSKLTAGKEKYEDFDRVTAGIQFDRYPNVVHILSAEIDNAADVLYHLSKDEAKMAQLERDAEDPRFQHIALSNARKLAQSLKDNESAAKVRVPNEPLSQLRPSNTGTDNGVMSVRDYRAKYKV